MEKLIVKNNNRNDDLIQFRTVSHLFKKEKVRRTDDEGAGAVEVGDKTFPSPYKGAGAEGKRIFLSPYMVGAGAGDVDRSVQSIFFFQTMKEEAEVGEVYKKVSSSQRMAPCNEEVGVGVGGRSSLSQNEVFSSCSSDVVVVVVVVRESHMVNGTHGASLVDEGMSRDSISFFSLRPFLISFFSTRFHSTRCYFPLRSSCLGCSRHSRSSSSRRCKCRSLIQLFYTTRNKDICALTPFSNDSGKKKSRRDLSLRVALAPAGFGV